MPKFRKYHLENDSKIRKGENDLDIGKIYYNSFLEINDKKFTIGPEISRGAFGIVREILENKRMIVKEIELFDGDIKFTKKNLKKEIKYQNLASEYNLTDPIVLAYILKNKKESGIIMKKYQITLWDILEDNLIDLEIKMNYLKKVRKILEVLTIDAKICHCDFHLKNIMIDEKNKMKLIDFGNSFSLIKKPSYNLIDLETFTNSLNDLEDIDEDDKIELIEYWEDIIDGFSDYIIDY